MMIVKGIDSMFFAAKQLYSRGEITRSQMDMICKRYAMSRDELKPDIIAK